MATVPEIPDRQRKVDKRNRTVREDKGKIRIHVGWPVFAVITVSLAGAAVIAG